MAFIIASSAPSVLEAHHPRHLFCSPPISSSAKTIKQNGKQTDKGRTIMKLTQILLCAAVAGTIAFVAGKASAFPLTLKFLSGKLTTTAYYGDSAATTTNKYTVKSFNLKEVMFLITNTVASTAPGVTLPEKVALAVDLYNTNNIRGIFARNVYLTNSQGFYFSLTDSNLASFSIGGMATKFKSDAKGGGSENDVVQAHLIIGGVHDQNFEYYEIEIGGTGKLNMNLNRDGMATMTFSVNGDGFGVCQSSDAGVCVGSFTLKGSGVVPTDGMPYSVYWWNSRMLGTLPQDPQSPITDPP
jgi:hypothetical protein